MCTSELQEKNAIRDDQNNLVQLIVGCSILKIHTEFLAN